MRKEVFSALVMSSPTVADLTDGRGGDGVQVLVGTHMGRVHVVTVSSTSSNPTSYVPLDLSSTDETTTTTNPFPFQMPCPIERLIVVEDVVPSPSHEPPKLEIFVADVCGNVVCLDSTTGRVVWKCRLLRPEERAKDGGSKRITDTSPMLLGNVDGDGTSV